MGSEGGFPNGKNALPLPQRLADSIQITEAYLKQFHKTQNFQVYRVLADFFPLDKRHLRVNKGEKVVGFAEQSGWICAFKESSKKDFGFVPKEFYLKFERQTNSQNVTPKSDVGGKADTKVAIGKVNEQVRSFLDEIYDVAND